MRLNNLFNLYHWKDMEEDRTPVEEEEGDVEFMLGLGDCVSEVIFTHTRFGDVSDQVI